MSALRILGWLSVTALVIAWLTQSSKFQAVGFYWETEHALNLLVPASLIAVATACLRDESVRLAGLAAAWALTAGITLQRAVTPCAARYWRIQSDLLSAVGEPCGWTLRNLEHPAFAVICAAGAAYALWRARRALIPRASSPVE